MIARTIANDSSAARTAPAARATSIPEPAHLRATFDANPELRAAWRDSSAYRESFATPEAARQATALLADVNHMDALFFSHRPEDHASLARAIANLDPAAFTSLAQAMQSIAASSAAHASASSQSQASIDGSRTAGVSPAPLPSSTVGARHAVPERARCTPAPSTPSDATNVLPSNLLHRAERHDRAKVVRRARHAVPLQKKDQRTRSLVLQVWHNLQRIVAWAQARRKAAR
jgi:hypothetical protein